MKIKVFLKKNRLTKKPYYFIKKKYIEILQFPWFFEIIEIKVNLKKAGKKIIYCGMCEGSNMGDMAQVYCSQNWIVKNFPDYRIVTCHTSTLLNPKYQILNNLKKYVNGCDLFIFQCGYNTHDLGGHQDEMHQLIMQEFPDNILIMLPQTIYFKSAEKKRKCSEVYNAHKKLFFMVRDPVSLQLAKEMFPNIYSVMYPDIVTTLIGRYYNSCSRSNICLCMRNDVEQFYSIDDRKKLMAQLNVFDNVDLIDTVIKTSYLKIQHNIEKYVWSMVDFFSTKRLTVTDKYHGMIFSLIANTPTIILKTTDHKLTSVYTWFKQIYPDRLFLANSLEEVVFLAKEILADPHYDALREYFDTNYYCKLLDEILAWEKSFLVE